MKIIAVIPARAGSQRVPGKNLRALNGHPLLAYSIAHAQQVGCCDAILVSSEDDATCRVAQDYGAAVCVRPLAYSQADSPDSDWLRHLAHEVEAAPDDLFVLLRPTSPFRSARWIREALQAFMKPGQPHDSVRSLRRVTEHPGKMWQLIRASDDLISPLCHYTTAIGVPWHSSPTQALPVVYVQTSALEIGRFRNILEDGTLHGRTVGALFGCWPEDFAIDTEHDWQEAERLAAAHPESLPSVCMAPLSAAARP